MQREPTATNGRFLVFQLKLLRLCVDLAVRDVKHFIAYADMEVCAAECMTACATAHLNVQPGAMPLTAQASAAYERGPSGSPSM